MEPFKKSAKHTISREEFKGWTPEEKIMKFSEGFVLPEGKNESEILKNLLNSTDRRPGLRKRTYTLFMQAAAAVFILVISFYGITYVLGTEHINTRFGEHKEFLLPDGSIIILNAGSSISWNKHDFEISRKITLKGHAFLKVVKGNPFTINTSKGTVEVLGTELDVFTRENEFRVACKTGKVRVNNESSSQILISGELALLEDGILTRQTPGDISRITSWREGLFYFEHRPVSVIFAEIQRQFDIPVIYNAGKERLITVTFSGSDLKEALDVVCIPMGFTYEIQKKKVFIRDQLP